MNTRCYRCGRSFSIGREAVEAAAVASAGQKFHVVYCPNCRTAIKMPMDQVMRELPPGWQPPAPAADVSQQPAVEAPSAEPAAPPEVKVETEAEHKSHRRHRRAKSPDSPAVVTRPVEEPAPVAQSITAQPAVDAPASELETPAPKRTRKRKATAAEETAPAEGADNGEPVEPAAAAKKTTRKRAKPKAG
jgi:hypothetical protein